MVEVEAANDSNGSSTIMPPFRREDASTDNSDSKSVDAGACNRQKLYVAEQRNER